MTTRIWRVVVTTLVILSLALNIFLLLLLSQARNGLDDAIAVVRNTLAVMGEEPFEISVEVDKEIPINTSIPISQTVTVPINIDYPLSTIVNTSFNIPVLGRQEISFPIETVIPVHMNLDIPVQDTVHISITYPLQIQIPVKVGIPIEVRALLDESLQEIGESFK